MPNRRALSPAVVLTACSLAAAAGIDPRSRVEVSEDGLTRVELTLADSAPAHASTRGTTPFPLTPDWTLALRRQVGAVRIADMNADGLRDIVVCCYISNSVPAYPAWRDLIFFNQGGGTFTQTPGWVSTDQSHTGDAQIADIDMDGDLDLLAVTGGGGFPAPRIYFGGDPNGPTPSAPNQTAGWIATPPTSGWATSAALFDADNDNDLDIITTNQGVSPNPFRPMYFFRNLTAQGAGIPTAPVWQSGESSIQNSVAAADFDHDGLPEIAVAKWVNFRSALYENIAGTPSLAPTWEVTTTNGDRGTAWADVDNNGWTDLVIGGSSTVPTRLYSNTNGVLTQTWSPTLAFVGQQELTLEDINRDSRPDYADVHFSNGQTHIFLNSNGTLNNTPDWTFDAPEVGTALDFGDVNGDNWPDLVVGYSGDNSVRLFIAVPPPPPPCPADLNGDSQVNTQDLTILLFNFASTVPPNTLGDLNGDGTVNTQDLTLFLSAFGNACP
ncbi:MAG: FG-GAP-like repeat-containing protein [Phycisphaerales bacterium]